MCVYTYLCSLSSVFIVSPYNSTFPSEFSLFVLILKGIFCKRISQPECLE